jgi:hypothetical protein
MEQIFVRSIGHLTCVYSVKVLKPKAFDKLVFDRQFNKWAPNMLVSEYYNYKLKIKI